MTIRTVGHGTATADEIVSLLEGANVATIVDVRRYPGSRRHPQLGREEMEGWLGDAGISYRWLEGLGGRRRADPDSPNVALRNPQFRAYADHMTSPEFASALHDLLAIAAAAPSAVMCSESVWWRCHRRLLADHLVLVEGIDVLHLFHDGRQVPHPVTPGARPAGDHVRYDDVLV